MINKIWVQKNVGLWLRPVTFDSRKGLKCRPPFVLQSVHKVLMYSYFNFNLSACIIVRFTIFTICDVRLQFGLKNLKLKKPVFLASIYPVVNVVIEQQHQLDRQKSESRKSR